MTKITVTSSENYALDNLSGVDFPSFKAFDALLSSLDHTYPVNGSYDKTHYTITREDEHGNLCTWSGRIDMVPGYRLKDHLSMFLANCIDGLTNPESRFGYIMNRIDDDQSLLEVLRSYAGWARFALNHE